MAEGLAWGEGKYVIVGGFSQIFTSTDGNTWLEATTIGHFHSLGSLRDITYNGNEFVLVGSELIAFANSNDGDTWIKGNKDGWTKGLNDVAWIGDRYLAVGQPTSISAGLFLSGPPPGTKEELEEFLNGDKPPGYTDEEEKGSQSIKP